MTHTPPPCGVCAHHTYCMSCEDFDAFVAEYGDACAICGRAGHETGHGFLVIDHDCYVGQWAVRGRLCTSCNTRIADGKAQTPADAAYLADPWYQRWFAVLGLNFTPEPEPAIGAIVAVQKKRCQHWRRSKDGWQRTSKYSRQTSTWRNLNRSYGPHRIRIVSGQMALL